MSYRVPLISRTGAPILDAGEGGTPRRLCLGHLVRMLHRSAVRAPGGDFREVIQFAEERFERVSGWFQVFVSTPAFSASSRFSFRGIGAWSWGARNVRGVLEIFSNGDQYVQAGFLVEVSPVIFGLGARRALTNVKADVTAAMDEIYPDDEVTESEGLDSTLLLKADEDTVCYVRLPSKERRVGFRICNPEFWSGE